MAGIHGGDIYRNQVVLDFSVNVNPLGIPESVKKAMRRAVEVCDRYPDMMAEQLKRAVSNMLMIKEEYLLFGNGASELFMAAVHGILPKRTVIPVPSFYGYEYAAEAGAGKVLYYETKQKEGFGVTKEFYEVLTEETALLFIGNPNNPTGRLLEKAELIKLLQHCREKGILVLLDECFIEFSGRECSMLSETGQFDNLLLVGAFTKSFAVPGVRLGYLVNSNAVLREKIKRQLPEWNLSCFAQAAGCACAEAEEELVRLREYVKRERRFLEKGLERLGIRCFPSDTNFILLYSEAPLYGRLLERGLLIRDCSNFRGLGKGFYRIAVKKREENEILLTALEECLKEMSVSTGR